jgi:hypothetical protein
MQYVRRAYEYGQPLAGKLLQRAETEDAKVSRIKKKIAALSG